MVREIVFQLQISLAPPLNQTSKTLCPPLNPTLNIFCPPPPPLTYVISIWVERNIFQKLSLFLSFQYQRLKLFTTYKALIGFVLNANKCARDFFSILALKYCFAPPLSGFKVYEKPIFITFMGLKTCFYGSRKPQNGFSK